MELYYIPLLSFAVYTVKKKHLVTLQAIMVAYTFDPPLFHPCGPTGCHLV